MPSPGYRISGKEVEVRGTGSRHHQLCGCCNLQLIQNHGAPSHGPPAGVLSPLFFPAKSLLLPKPPDEKKHSKTTWSSPIHSIRTSWSSPFPSEPHSPPTIRYTCQHSPFFQLYWAAIVSPGRCGPVAWSQSSPSSQAVTVRGGGSCLPVAPRVEVTPIPLAQRMAPAV